MFVLFELEADVQKGLLAAHATRPDDKSKLLPPQKHTKDRHFPFPTYSSHKWQNKSNCNPKK